MEISLEQINNRIQGDSVQVRISKPNTCYRGVRLKKKEGYLQISQKGYDCFVSGSNKDYICFRNADMKEVMEKILDIFDAYSQWEKIIIQAAREQDFAAIANCSWDVFSNPTLICDDNLRILAQFRNMTEEQFAAAYPNLVDKGAVSSQIYTKHQRSYTRQKIDPASRPIYLQYEEGKPNSNILCGILKRDEAVFGHLFVMEYSRPLNTADLQNLQFLCDLVSEYLAPWDKDNQTVFGNVLLRLMEGISVQDEEIDSFYAHSGWDREDVLQVVTVDVSGAKLHQPQRMLMYSCLKEMFMELPCFLMGSQILLVGNKRIMDSERLLSQIEQSYVYEQDVTIGVSLPFKGIKLIKEFEKQSQYALQKLQDGKIRRFFDCAVDYIISSNQPVEKLCACMPMIKTIYVKREQDQKELYTSMKSYLLCGGSLTRAAEALGIHKNTLSYRIGKFFQTIAYDGDDPYVREYMLLSIRVIENLQGLVFSEKYYRF